MSTSKFCIQQRQREQQRLKKFLIFGFTGSAILHGILAYALPRWSFESPNQAKEPMELIIVDKPKPKPKPKVESKPIVKPEPKPLPKPEPVKAKTPPPPVKPPKPVPKPAPKKVLTTPTTVPSQPIVSAPVENTAQPFSLSNSFTTPNSSSVTDSAESNINNPGVPGSVVATNSAPPRPEASSQEEEGISCVSNCEPEYPAALEGVEGSAGVKLTIDSNGNVIGAELLSADSNSQINREALLVARQMQFSSPGDDAASVQVKIDFTVEGSQYDRLAREEQERKEQAAKEQQELEAARQQQIEAEKQAQQEQLKQEREARARQEQRIQQEQQSIPNIPTESKPLPALSETEVDDEQLQKFRERMEQYREE